MNARELSMIVRFDQSRAVPVTFREDGEPERWFENHYEHADCPVQPGVQWTDEHTAACNDRCPACDREIEPTESVELDLCDCCMTAGVTVSRTTRCGKTVGVECGCEDQIGERCDDTACLICADTDPERWDGMA